MGYFDFLGFEKEKIERISDYIESKYGIKIDEVRKELKESQDNSDERFEELMIEFIAEIVFKEENLEINSFSMSICRDVEIALYMFMGYYDSEKCSIGDSIKDLLYIFHEMIPEEEKKEGKKEENKKGIKYNLTSYKYFPFLLEFGEDTEAWCENYKVALFCNDNIGIYDIEYDTKKGQDITKYGFQKTKKIYDNLFSEKIENILMLDISLGLSLTNIIYWYCHQMSKKDRYNKIRNIVRKIATIFGINMRNDLENCVFCHLSDNYFSDSALADAEERVNALVPLFNECFSDALQVIWWWKIKEEGMGEADNRKKYVDDKRNELFCWWNSFYDDQKLYKDILEFEKLNLVYFEDNNSPEKILYNLKTLFRESERLSQKYGKELDIVKKKKSDKEVVNDEMNISVKNIIEGIKEEKYLKFISSKNTEQIKFSTKKVRTIDLYAIIHMDVVQSGLRYFNTEVFKKVKCFDK